jgi:hypothetical protein
MTHQTIRRNADGSLTSIDCPCGEDHGPSLHEELAIMRAGNKRQAQRLTDLATQLERVLELTTAAQLNGANRIKARRLVKDTADAIGFVAHDLTVMC